MLVWIDSWAMRSGLRWLVALSPAVLVVALGTSCRDATAISIRPVAGAGVCDARGPRDSKLLSLFVGPPGAVPADVRASQRGCADGALGTVTLVPSDRGNEIEVHVDLNLTPGGADTDCERGAKGCIVARRRVVYVEHRSLTLDVRLDLSCLDVTCDPDSTCSAGRCVPSRVECLGASCELPGPPAADGGVEAASSLLDAEPSAQLDAARDASPALCDRTIGKLRGGVSGITAGDDLYIVESGKNPPPIVRLSDGATRAASGLTGIVTAFPTLGASKDLVAWGTTTQVGYVGFDGSPSLGAIDGEGVAIWNLGPTLYFTKPTQICVKYGTTAPSCGSLGAYTADPASLSAGAPGACFGASSGATNSLWTAGATGIATNHGPVARVATTAVYTGPSSQPLCVFGAGSELRRLDPNGATAPLDDVTGDSIAKVVVVGTDIVYATTNGAVRTVPLSGAKPKSLGGIPDQVIGLAVTSSCVFVLNDQGDLYGVAR